MCLNGEFERKLPFWSENKVDGWLLMTHCHCEELCDEAIQPVHYILWNFKIRKDLQIL